jgi:hypothetical protein
MRTEVISVVLHTLTSARGRSRITVSEENMMDAFPSFPTREAGT